MNITTLLPTGVNPDNAEECADVLGAVLTAAHFERWRARNMGWRGVKPCMTLRRAWTCKVARSPHVFGMVFQHPEPCPLQEGAAHGFWGRFELPVFPASDSPELERFPLRALSTAMDEDYSARVRDLNFSSANMEAFHAGSLWMGLRTDGLGLTLLFDAHARRRMVALDGVAGHTDKGKGWVIPPGARETDIPAQRTLLPLMACLAATFRHAFQCDEGDMRWRFAVRSLPLWGFTASGEVQQAVAHGQHSIFTAIEFGKSLLDDAGFGSARRGFSPQSVDTASASRRPALHVLSGFLGSGKTTFLREWLDFLQGRDRFTGVIQNEFGQMGLDATLLRDDTHVEALDEGCVCCTLSDSLRPGIARMLELMPGEDILLETSGLANPLNVREALAQLDDMVRPGLMLCVTDALDLSRALVLGETPEDAQLPLQGVALAQVRSASVLVLNKIDTVSTETRRALRAALARLNPEALLLEAAWGRIPFALLDQLADEDRPAQSAQGPCLLPRFADINAAHCTHMDEGYQSRLIPMEHPVERHSVTRLVEDSGAVRVKGLVRLLEGWVVVQYAARTLYFEPLPEDFTGPGYLVFIGNALRPEFFSALETYLHTDMGSTQQ